MLKEGTLIGTWDTENTTNASMVGRDKNKAYQSMVDKSSNCHIKNGCKADDVSTGCGKNQPNSRADSSGMENKDKIA